MAKWHDWLPVALRDAGGKLAKTGNTAAAVKAAEKKVGLRFPRRYREFISAWNGGELRVRLLTLPQVIRAAKAKRGNESDPHGELPAHFVPIAAEPHGLELYCLSTERAAGDRVFVFDPERPDSSSVFPDFEAMLLDRVSSGADLREPEGQYLAKLVRVHGIDWDADEPLAKWKTWETCRAKIPPPPKPVKNAPIQLEQFRPGVLGLHKGFHSVSGHFGRDVVGKITSTTGKTPTWTLSVSKGPAKEKTRTLDAAELRLLWQAVQKYIEVNRYQGDKDWSGLAAALQKSSSA